MVARLILAIVSTVLEEIALVVIWRWGLPQIGISLPPSTLIAVMVAWAAYATATFWVVTRTLKRKAVVGLPAMIGGRGKVVNPLAPDGQVIIKGELWMAKSASGNIDIGEGIIVVGQDGLKLIVRMVSNSDSKQAG